MFTIYASFKELLQDKPIIHGRSMIFTVPKHVKDAIIIQKLEKIVKKKEKKIEVGAQNTRKAILEQQALSKKSKNF